MIYLVDLMDIIVGKILEYFKLIYIVVKNNIIKFISNIYKKYKTRKEINSKYRRFRTKIISEKDYLNYKNKEYVYNLNTLPSTKVKTRKAFFRRKI